MSDRPNQTRAAAEARARRVRAARYAIRLDLSEEDTYRGEVEIDVELAGRGPLDLDFQGREVTAIEVNGKAVPTKAFRKPRIRIPGKTLKTGRNRIRVAYATRYDNDGMGLHRSLDPADGRAYHYAVMCPFDANRVFPCLDQPDLKATYALTVEAPDHWLVVANAPVESQRDEGRRRVHAFKESRPFSTYLVSLAAGPFACWTDHRARVPSRILATQSMAPHVHVTEIFDVTRRAMDFYEDYFDIPYPFEKYDQVFCPHFNWGAMENVACVLHSDGMIFRHDPTLKEREDRANTVVHELAHMWFGNLVTMRWWNDLWLNESFATYMASLCLARASDFPDAWETFAQDTKAWAYWQDELVTTHPIEMAVPDTDTTFTNFDGITYGKGASVLKQLAFYLGEEAFRAGVSTYLKKYSWRNAALEDFLACLGEAAGVDLDGWARLWLQSSGTNVLAPKVTTRGGAITRFEITQAPGNGDAVLRPHRLKVALHRAAGKKGALAPERVVEVEVQDRRTRVRELEGAPAPDLVDLNHEDHAFARIHLDPASLAFAREGLAKVGDPMLRSALWQRLWFMVRDAALPPADFVGLALAAAPAEPSAPLLESVLEDVATCLESYLEEAEATRLRRRLHALAIRRLAAAKKGSDHAKVWLHQVVATATSRKELGTLAGWLEEGKPVRGLELDPDKRWGMVRRLAVLGDPRTGALLEREIARDPTERGQQAAFRATASLPDPVEKERAFERFLHDETSALGFLREGMRGFRGAGQLALLEPWTKRFFAAIPEVARTRGNFYVDAFVASLYPADDPRPATVARTKKFLKAHPDMPRSVTRKLTELADEVSRAIRIRKAAAR